MSHMLNGRKRSVASPFPHTWVASSSSTRRLPNLQMPTPIKTGLTIGASWKRPKLASLVLRLPKRARKGKKEELRRMSRDSLISF